jgi:outer membrane receptor protein involved in Fe transport
MNQVTIHIIFLFLLGTFKVQAQINLHGRVVNEKNEPLPGASIRCGNKKAITGENGFFHLIAESSEKVFTCSHIGYITNTITTDSSFIAIQLTPVYAALTEVQVQSQTSSIIQRQAIAPAVIDARKFYNRSTGMADILNQVTGVHVRQEGGLGSRSEVSLNGITGKQVKYFLDGIPIDYLGQAAALNVLPVQMIERVDIYKGVVPIELGTDALGGAISITSRKDLYRYADISVEHSSFNTTKLNMNSRYTWKNNFYFSLNSFYNQSDNNYQIDAEIPDEFGNPKYSHVRRFHDRFSNYRINAEAGVSQQSWADLFSIGLTRSGLNKQIQHNILMTQPYGKANFDEHTTGSYIKWSHKNIWPGLNAATYVSYNKIQNHFLDTSLNAYTWDGKVYARRAYGGEISGSRNDLHFAIDNLVGRINMQYAIDSQHTIKLNILSSMYERKGYDTIAAGYYGKDLYQNPTRLRKFSAGISWQFLLDRLRITLVSSGKLFSYYAQGYSIINTEAQVSLQRMTRAGFNQALKWQASKKITLKGAYEYAARLPDEYELFGDFALVKPNPNLFPEVSHNVNASAVWNETRWNATLTAFYRRTSNIIYLKTIQLFAQYQNLLKAQITGLEAEFAWKPLPVLHISINGTFQNIINKTSQANSSSPDSRYYNLRLPNIPYLLANSEVSYRKNNFQCWWNTSYVHWFYLYWAVDGRPDLKATIPSQFIQNTGANYQVKRRYTIGAEIHNLTDRKAYDNFSVQRPGRSFHIKAGIFIESLINKN